MHADSAAKPDASSLRIGVAVSRYHRDITDALLQGATEAFAASGGRKDALLVVDAPGSWELTAVCKAMAEMEGSDGRAALDGIVALGCILTGETTHDQYIAQSITQGLTAVTLASGVPVTFGVLTCQSIEQARARSGGESNKGVEAMRAAIVTANTLRRLRQAERSVIR